MEKQTALVFLVRNRLFGVESSLVHEVVLHHFIVRMNNGKSPFFAQARIKTDTIPLVCSCQQLGLTPPQPSCHGHIVVFKLQLNERQLKIGALVEGVEGLMSYTEDEVLPFAGSRKNSSFSGMMTGTVMCNNMPVYLLDASKFLGIDEVMIEKILQEDLFRVA